MDIIWICLFTTFICTYTMLHAMSQRPRAQGTPHKHHRPPAILDGDRNIRPRICSHLRQRTMGHSAGICQGVSSLWISAVDDAAWVFRRHGRIFVGTEGLGFVSDYYEAAALVGWWKRSIWRFRTSRQRIWRISRSRILLQKL
jgi:hypothetical protein